MANLLSVSGLMLIITLFYSKRFECFFSFLFLYILVFPAFQLGNFYLSNVYIVLFVLIYFLLGARAYKPDNLSISYFVFGLLIISFKTFSWLLHGRLSTGGFIPIIGSFKLILIILVLSALYNEIKSSYDINIYNIIDKFIFAILVVNLLSVTSQLFFPEFSINFFYNLYWSPSNTPLERAVKMGRFTRMYGSFGSPVQFGMVFLIIWAYLLGRYVSGEGKKYFWLAIFSLTVGLSGLSKTFIMGVPLLIVISLIFGFIFNKIDKRVIKRLPLAALIFVIVITAGYFILDNNGAFISYYFKFLTNPVKAFYSRYSSNDNIPFAGTYEVIARYPILGVGPEAIKGEFIGDSSYVKTLHDGGLLSLYILFLSGLYLFIYFVRNKQLVRLLILASIFLGGISLPTVYSSELIVPFLFLITNQSYIEIRNIIIDRKDNGYAEGTSCGAPAAASWRDGNSS